MPAYAHIPQVDGRSPSPAVHECFERPAPALLGFASDHSLLVRKFYRDQPMWTFHFLHPKGGFGMIQVHAIPLGGVGFKAAVGSNWWIDDYDANVRAGLSTPSTTLESDDPTDVVSALEHALSDLLLRTSDQLSASSVTMPRKRDARGKYVFSEFERAQRLPT